MNYLKNLLCYPLDIDINEYEMMEDFVETIEDIRLQN